MKPAISLTLGVILITTIWLARADDTVYNPKEPTLAQVNKSMSATILQRPYKHVYAQARAIKPEQWFHVDLRKVCNMGFKDGRADDHKGGWTDSGSRYDLDPFGPGFGIRKFYGVPFDIIDPAKNQNRTMLTMKSGWKTHAHFPDQVRIPVRQKAKLLYFFHGSSYAGTQWGMGATRRYEVVFADKTFERIPVICAGGHENMCNWMWSPSGGTPLLETSAAKPVPIKIGRATRYLYTLQWVNPHPDKTIEHIAVITRNDGKWYTLVLLAITGVK